MMLVAKRELWYAGKTYLKGQMFEATASDGKVLKQIKKAEDVEFPPPPPSHFIIRGAPVLPMDTGNSAPISPVKRGRYGRRDMVAGETDPPVAAVVAPEPPVTPETFVKDDEAEAE